MPVVYIVFFFASHGHELISSESVDTRYHADHCTCYSLFSLVSTLVSLFLSGTFMNLGYICCNPHISCLAPALYLPVPQLVSWNHLRIRPLLIIILYNYNFPQPYHLVVVQVLTQILFNIMTFVNNVTIIDDLICKRTIKSRLVTTQFFIIDGFISLKEIQFPCFRLKYWFSLDSGILYFLNSVLCFPHKSSQDHLNSGVQCHTWLK